MKHNSKNSYTITALSIILSALAVATPANSQPITPAKDGTGTTVNKNGNQFNIQGGTRNGANLFHSFDKFNVPTNQTANFLTTPDTRNILGRVTGGASYINGLIQVIGGNSNLYLMNPAGVIFGRNASLNVPASFSVTTATGIGFDSNNYWFKAMGTNDYANLVGNPSGYKFNLSNPGAIVNEGNLSLNPGENLTLLGGTVINTGELSTAGGNITIAAVEGGSVLRISQPGHLLSLEVETLHATSLQNGEDTDITPLSLPELLTGGETTHATSVIVNDNGDVVLTDSNTLVADTPGTAIVSGKIDVSIPPNPPYEGGDISSFPLFKGDGRGIGGQVNVLGDRVALIDTNINANGLNGGGTVLIGGDFQGNGIVPNSQHTFVNNNSFISADVTTNGDGGQVIIWSDGITNFAGNISAKGGAISGDGGFVEVSGKQQLIFNGTVDVSAAFGNPGTILLDPENVTVGDVENSDNSETETESLKDNSESESTENTDSDTTENLEDSESLEDNSESESTENLENLETTEIADNSEFSENTNTENPEIAENSETTETETYIDPFAEDENADVTISAENIGELSGDVILQADNDITVNERIETTESVELKAGRSIYINADIDTSVGNGNIDLFGNNNEMDSTNRSAGKASINQLDGTTLNAGSGTINIELGNLGEVGDINLASLTTTGQVLVNANGGNIARVSENSLINAGSVLFQTSGNAGIGLIDSPLRLNVENLEAVSGSGGVFFDVGNVNVGGVSEDVDGIVTAGGDIDIKSDGDVTLIETIDTSSFDGDGGNVEIKAVGDITTAEIITDSGEFVLMFDRDGMAVFNEDYRYPHPQAISTKGGSGNAGKIRIESTAGSINTTAGSLLTRSVSGNAGNVEITAAENITTADITTYSGDQNSGNITIESTTGAIDITEGLNASSSDGNGGNIQIKAAGDINTSGITTQSNHNAGNITIESTTGAIDTTAKFSEEYGGFVRALSGDGNGGNIQIKAAGDITTADITAASETQAGNITIESTAGAITAKDNIDARGQNNGGEIQIKAEKDISTGSIATSAEENAGNITIESTAGAITALSNIDARGKNNGGNIQIKAAGDITTEDITAASETQAGNITIESTAGAITAQDNIFNIDAGIDARGKNNGGNIQIKAERDITTATIVTSAEENAGNITIESTAGTIDTTAGFVIASSDDGDGGDIEMRAVGNISTANITTDSGEFDFEISESGFEMLNEVDKGSGNAGNIIIETTAGHIDTTAGSVEARSVSGNGGNIAMTAGGDIKTRQVESFSSSISERNSGNGGDITMTAGGDIINTEWLDASFADTNKSGVDLERENGGDGGNISLSAEGDIIAGWLYSFSFTQEGNSGDGGNITLTANGNINTYSFDSFSFTQEGNSGNGGDITLTANGNISFNTKKPFAENGDREQREPSFSDLNPRFLDIDPRGFANPLNDSYSSGIEPPSPDPGGVPPASPKVIEEQLSQHTLGIRTFSVGTVGTNEPGNGGDVNITANNVSNTEIFTLSSHSQSGEVTIESQPEGNLELNNLSIITSKQVNTQVPFQGEVTIDLGTQGQSGPVSIISNGNLNLNNVTIESDTKGDNPAGNVNIYSLGNITLDNTDILSTTNGQGNAGTITLETPKNIQLTNSSKLLASTEARGNAGNAGTINIRANNLNLDQNTSLITETTGAGNPGAITIEAETVDIGQDAQISATVVIGSTSDGDGGNITINTNQLNITGKLGIFAETEATANAGTLTLSSYKGVGERGSRGERETGAGLGQPDKFNSTLNITFSNDGFISASTSSTGNGGNIFITAPENIDISGEGFIAVETSGTGNAGIIDIQTENLTISDGVGISASTEDKGNAGQININTRDFILKEGTSLTTETNSAGKAGDIEITTEKLTIGENAQISATAQKGATNEAGGNITINANDLVISGKLGIFAETAGNSPAGTLTLNPYKVGTLHATSLREQVGKFDPNLNITFKEKGFISARTTSIGNGGDINIFAPENINISGDGFISVETTGKGNAGEINIETENLTIAENTKISASTSSSGDGGRININPSQTFQLEGQILTETTGTGNGGTITINTGEMTAPNSTISAKSTDAGNAGEINIAAENNITTGIITSEASNENQTAKGGDISITSEQGEINATQVIQSFSNRGNAGDVTLKAETDINTNTISSHGQQEGGQITITSETGNIDTSKGEFLANYSGGGDAGNLLLEAPQGNITTTNIYSFANRDGGQINVKAGGNINITEESNIISASEPQINDTYPPNSPPYEGRGRGKGGDIILEAANNINTTTARIFSGADVGNTGKVNIIADGAIETGQIDLASGFVRDRVTVNENFTLIPVPQGQATQGVAGNITLNSNNSTIDTSAGIINSRSPDGTGNISLNARGNITTGKLEASALNPDKPTTGGNVEIISQQGEINATQAIETFSKQGTAGNVNIIAEGHIHTNTILSQGMEQGGNITINSRSENSIDAAGALNTYSDEGIAGDVTVTSPGSIDISSIRSEGMKQGGDITVASERGEINSTGNIDSYSDQGKGGNVEVNAPQSVTLADVSSYGMTESGNLIIQSRTATVNTGDVKTQAPVGSSGSIVINGAEVGTGNLRSISKISAGEINVEATDGSIKTYDITMSSDGTIGNLTLRATEDITTEDINQNAGEGDANINIESGEDQNIGNINQIAETGDTNNIQTAQGDINTGNINQIAGGDTNNIQTAEGNQNIGNVNQIAGNNTSNIQTAGGNQNIGNVTQTAGNNTTNIQIAEGNQNIGNVTQTAGNDATNIQTAGGNQNLGNITQTAGNNTTNIQPAGGQQNLGEINQTFGNESINIQNPGVNQNTDSTSVISNNNSTNINPVINQTNSQNNTNPLNNSTNNTTTNSLETNTLSTITTSEIISTATPSNNNQTANTTTAQNQTESSINNTTDTQQILKIIDTPNTNTLTVATGSNQVINMLEQSRTQEYSDYLGTDFNQQFLSTKNVREILTDMSNQTGKESAVVYINAYPDQLQLILYTKDGQPIIKTIPDAQRKKLMKVALKLRAHITNPIRRYTDSYLPPAQQLYDWLIAPISAELEVANIDTLLFSMDEGLRTLPVAVLHDGEQFLIEKYSISLIPSVSLMDTNYRPLQDTQVLAMGASEFLKQEPLPGVPVEIQTISEKLWQGNMFLNEKFTRNNLLTQRQNYPYPIIHLATHAEFLPGQPSNSYIQLWESEQIKLDQIRELDWSQPAVELLVLSACRTAVGDRNAELGFAGLAVAAGVKSALASIWYVSDEGTLGLMTEFYVHLNNAKIKAEALRQAQLAMLRGEVVIAEGELRGPGIRGAVVLPSALGNVGNQDLSHPYYWAGFTMVGSPW